MATRLKVEDSDRSPSLVLKSAITLVLVATAVIAAKLLEFYWKSEAFGSLFFSAIIFSAWFGGFRQGLLAITLSTFAFDYFFLEPIHSFAVNLDEAPRLIIFVLCGLLVAFLAATQRSNTASLRRARDDLAAKVQELNRTIDALHGENTERRRVERALRNSQAYLSEAQRLSHTGSFGWHVATSELFWSEETFHIFQIDPKTKPGLELVIQRVHPDDAMLVKETIKRASQDGKDFDFEHRLLMPDASVKHVHVVAHAEMDESGEIEFVGAVMDVTAAKDVEAKIRLMINTVPGLLWTARPDGWVDFLNQRWLDYTGMALEQGLGWAWQPGYHPDDLGNVLSKWRGAVAARKPLEVEARLRRFDGEYRWFLKRAFPLFDHAGRVLGWYGGNIDVHDLKQAEEKLRRIENYLLEGQRLSRTGSWAWSVKTKENLYWSREHYRIYGFDPDTDRGQYEVARERIHPADLPAFDQKLERAIQEQSDFEIAYRIVLPDGEMKYIQSLGHPIMSNSGELIEYIGTTMDVTERTRAEEALRKSEYYLAEAQGLTHTGSWAYNILSGELVHSSEEHRRLFGFDPEKGTPSFDELVLRIHPEDRSVALREFEAAPPSGKDFDAHFRIVLPDGTMKYVYGTGHPVLNQSGEVCEFIGMVMDVTERKRAELETQAHLWFLESMDRINRAIQGATDLEEMMSEVLKAVLSIFNCDRAWLVYPCDPQAPTWRAVMEHVRPEFPGAFALGVDLPLDPEVAAVFKCARGSRSSVCFGPASDDPVPSQLAKGFSIRSMIGLALYPKLDKPYIFGLHQCTHPRVWTLPEQRLFQEIGRRMEDALSALLMFRNLQNSEARLEEAQRIAHVGHWERDLDTGLITWSDEIYRIYGLAPQERILNLSQMANLLHPEDRQKIIQAIAEAVNGGRPYNAEFRVIRPSGEVRFVHSQGDIIKDESGRPRRHFGTVQDITERKLAEEALRRSETYLAEAQKLSHTGSWARSVVTDKITYWSKECFRVLGFEAHNEPPEFETFVQHIHPEDQARFKEMAESARLEKVDYQVDYRIVHPGGQIREIHAIGHPVFDPSGELVEYVGTVIDVTEQKRAEESLKASERELRLIAESIPGMIVVNTPDGANEYSTQRLLDYLGKELADLKGLRWVSIVHPEDSDAMVSKWLAAVKTGRPMEVIHRMRRADGVYRWFQSRVEPLVNEQGKILRWYGLIIDMDDQIKAAEALRKSQTELAHISRLTTMGELTASIAHEVNQPLTAVVNNANASISLLSKGTPNLEEVHEALAEIIDDANRASDVIARIRRLAKRAPVEKSLLDLRDVVQDVLALARYESATRQVTIRTDLSNDLPSVCGDRVQLQQVLLNLVINGMDAMNRVEESKRVLIIGGRPETHDGASRALIQVQDSGSGFKAEEMDRLFEAFYTTKSQGLGLGLAISRSIIEAHGGRLWAEPNLGSGATFLFSLPAATKVTS